MANRKPKVVRGTGKGRRVIDNSAAGNRIQLRHNDGAVDNAFDIAGFPDGLIREMLTGIVEQETAYADVLCGRQFRQKTTLEGGIPIRGTKASVARGENRNLPPGAEAKPIRYDVGSVSYKAGAYVGFSELTAEERGAAGAYFDQDAVALEIETAVRDANTALDRDLDAMLQSTSLNTEYALSVDWDDFGAVSSMFGDLKTLRQVTVPKADTIIIGRNAQNTMLQHDNLLAKVNQYSGGAADPGILESWLRASIGFTNVFIFDRLYNSDTDPSDAANNDYLFDDSVWVGYFDDIVMVHPDWEDQDRVDVEWVTRRRLHEVQFSRYNDLLRPTQGKGAIVTGLNAA